jgi:hypothetical protein
LFRHGETILTAPNQPGTRRFIELFDGGRDRDRTCDPYHVKVVSMAERAENQALSESLSSKSGMMFDGCSWFGVWRTSDHYIFLARSALELGPSPP